jgi:CRP-like cAMP-binding protein
MMDDESGMTQRRARARRTTVLLEEALDQLIDEDGAIEPLHMPKKERMVRELFDELDTAGTGTLNKEEVKMLAEGLGEQLTSFFSDRPLDEAFAAMDSDGDGEVTFEEFRAWWFKAMMDAHDDRCGAPGLVIHPHYQPRRYWDFALLVLIIFSAMYDPFKAAFGKQRYWYDNVIDAVYWFDMLLNFFTGYPVSAHSVELRHRRVVWNYLRGWFVIDLVATFPWDVALQGRTGSQMIGLVRLLRLVRVLRVLRMGRLLKRMSVQFQVRNAMGAILRFIFGLIIFLNLLGCLAFIVSQLAADGMNCESVTFKDAAYVESSYNAVEGNYDGPLKIIADTDTGAGALRAVPDCVNTWARHTGITEACTPCPGCDAATTLCLLKPADFTRSPAEHGGCVYGGKRRSEVISVWNRDKKSGSGGGRWVGPLLNASLSPDERAQPWEAWQRRGGGGSGAGADAAGADAAGDWRPEDQAMCRYRQVGAGKQYLISMYFAVSTTATCGFGDISPKNDPEILFTVFMQIIGVFLFCYTVTTLANLVNGLKAKDRTFRVNMDKMLEYMEDKETPQEMKSRVVEYMNFVHSSKFFTDRATETNVLSLLTPTLREQLVAETYRRHLWEIPFIADTAEEVGKQKIDRFVNNLTQSLQSVAAAPGDLVVREGEIGNGMFILLSGVVRVFTQSTTKGKALYQISHRDESPFFGFVEMMILINSPVESNVRGHASVEALNFCDLAYIETDAFMDAMADDELAEVRTAFLQLARKKLRETKEKNSRKSYAEIAFIIGENDDDDSDDDDDDPLGNGGFDNNGSRRRRHNGGRVGGGGAGGGAAGRGKVSLNTQLAAGGGGGGGSGAPHGGG